MTSNAQSPLSAYLSKLRRRIEMPQRQEQRLLELPVLVNTFADNEQIVKEGEDAKYCVFLLSGTVTRERQVNSRPRIVSINFPGDAIDLQTLFFSQVDSSLIAHGSTIVATVPQKELARLIDEDPYLAKVLWHDTLVDSAIFREWAVNVAHRRAPQRIGFLLLEMEARLAAIGLAQDGCYTLPLNQQEMASALGLSLVHFNKSLQAVRRSGHVGGRGQKVRLLDREALSKFVGYDPSYLQMESAPALGALLD